MHVIIKISFEIICEKIIKLGIKANEKKLKFSGKLLFLILYIVTKSYKILMYKIDKNNLKSNHELNVKKFTILIIIMRKLFEK